MDPGVRAIFAAARRGDAGEVAQLLQGPQGGELLDAQNAFQWTPLMAAASRGHEQVG
jgi:ankyrin repeat protein